MWRIKENTNISFNAIHLNFMADIEISFTKNNCREMVDPVNFDSENDASLPEITQNHYQYKGI